MDTAADRRGTQRAPCPVGIYCRSVNCPQPEYWPATVLDVSELGMGLVVERRFEKGTLLFVELQETHEYPLRSFLARVVRSFQRPDSHWVLGCVLSSKLNLEDMSSLIELSKKGSANERMACLHRTQAVSLEEKPGV